MKYLITNEYLKEVTSVTTNSVKELDVAFRSATEVHIKKLLKPGVYSRLLTGSDLTEVESELLEQVRYYMALRVEQDMLFNIVSVTAKGATQEAQQASLEVITAKRQYLESKAKTIETSIREFIQQHPQDFQNITPELQQGTTPFDYSCGIVFDNAPRIIYQ